ncbi:MAG: DUF3515 domain-containing protein [Candidatus Nanopelagicales bacterium]
MKGRATAGLLILLVTAGCSDEVAISTPTPDTSQAHVCAVLAAKLPTQLPEVGKRRETSPTSLFTAAWGDAPVSWRCGVPKPAALQAESTLVTVNGVDWFPEELTGGYLMTTVGRAVNVEITVPTKAGPAPSVAVDLAELIKDGNPKT